MIRVVISKQKLHESCWEEAANTAILAHFYCMEGITEYNNPIILNKSNLFIGDMKSVVSLSCPIIYYIYIFYISCLFKIHRIDGFKNDGWWSNLSITKNAKYRNFRTKRRTWNPYIFSKIGSAPPKSGSLLYEFVSPIVFESLLWGTLLSKICRNVLVRLWQTRTLDWLSDHSQLTLRCCIKVATSETF